MSVSFFVVDPLYTDGADLLLSPDAFPESKPDAKPLVVIWRLVATYDNRAPQGLYLPIDKTMVVDALSVLFPQLSTSSSTGPSLERIESCLARQETFMLLLATEITPHIYLPTGEASTPRVTIKIAKIVGCLTLITLQLLMKSRAHIEDLVVLDEYRGQGIGRGLMQRALNEAVEVRDCTMVDLTSRPDREQARALYESLGFTLRETGVFRFTKPTVG